MKAAETNTIARLEKHLGLTLLQRTTRRLHLTDEGAWLLARARAQLRRQARQVDGSPEVSFGNIHIDLTRRVVERAGERIHLTPIEYRLLTALTSQPDRVLTYQMLLKAVWGPGHAEDTHYLRVHMANLRRKIGEGYIRTVRGVGYVIDQDNGQGAAR